MIYCLVGFATRCPRGIKTVLYKKAKLEKFAEYLNQDGMTSRLTIYSDMTCKLEHVCSCVIINYMCVYTSVSISLSLYIYTH